MVTVVPFRGLRYAPEFRREPVYSPPYDVIDSDLRQELLSATPYNVVHVTLGPKDTPPQWYQEAAALFQRWLSERVLARDAVPAFYAYEQAFDGPGSHQLTRRGFFARVRLTPWGEGIQPHERTRSGPKADRLQLMRSLHAQESPVFAMYRDPQGAVDSLLGTPPVDAVRVTDADGVRHVCWPLTDGDLLGRISEFMEEHDLVIADGHHRYETALAYRDQVRGRDPQSAEGPQDYVLMYLTPVEQDSLVILPTHRVVTAPLPQAEERLLAALDADFVLQKVAKDQDLAAAMGKGDGIVLGMYLGSGSWTLTLRDRGRAHEATPGGEPQELAELDVCVLQNLVLAPHLGITAETLAHGDAVHYTVDAVEACQAVRQGSASAAFLLNPTGVDQVWQAAVAGVTMPQKSTYFFPKLLTGLVLNPLDA